MQHKRLLAITVVGLAAVYGAVAFALIGRAPSLPVPEPPRDSIRPIPAQDQGPVRVEIRVLSIETPKPEPEPPLKWEVVDDLPLGDASPEHEDQYGTWNSGEYVLKPPGEFPDLPPDVRDELQRRGCRIPQWTPGTFPVNLLWGEFDHRGQRDLVILCARERSAVAYIFWGGDVARMEALPFGKPGSTLTIATADDIEIHAYPNAKVTADMPRMIDHAVIEVSCCECCSSYYYRHLGKWFRAPGAD